MTIGKLPAGGSTLADVFYSGNMAESFTRRYFVCGKGRRSFQIPCHGVVPEQRILTGSRRSLVAMRVVTSLAPYLRGTIIVMAVIETLYWIAMDLFRSFPTLGNTHLDSLPYGYLPDAAGYFRVDFSGTR